MSPRLLPGILIPAALFLAFNLCPPPKAEPGRYKPEQRTQTTTQTPAPAPAPQPVPAAPAQPATAFFPHEPFFPAAESVTVPVGTRLPTARQRPTESAIVSSPVRMPAESAERVKALAPVTVIGRQSAPSAFPATQVRNIPHPAAEHTVSQTMPYVPRALDIPTPSADVRAAPSNRHGVASSTSLASLYVGGQSSISPCPTSICSDPPPKGLLIHGYGKMYQESQRVGWKNGLNSMYEVEGKMFGLGFMKDWSVATTLGLSADIISAKVTPGHEGDKRENEVTGYILNAHLKTSLMDKFPVDGTFMYGRIKDEGSGTWADSTGSYRWNEASHRSNLFGFSGKIGVPLVLGDDIKIGPSVGLDFIRLDSDDYAVTLDDGHGGVTTRAIGGRRSTSLAVPINLDLKMDFNQCFGTFTPRLTFGAIREFDDTAMGVRTFNASSGSIFRLNNGLSPMDKSQQWIYKGAVGFDLVTLSGWNVHADYTHLFAKKLKNNSFTLEISKCF